MVLNFFCTRTFYSDLLKNRSKYVFLKCSLQRSFLWICIQWRLPTHSLSCRPLTVSPFGWLLWCLWNVTGCRSSWLTEPKNVVHVNKIVVIIFISTYLRQYSTGVNWTGCKFDLLPLFCRFVKNDWISTSSLHFMPSWQLVTSHIQVTLFQSFEDILLVLNTKTCVSLKMHIFLVYCTVCKCSYRKVKIKVKLVLWTPRRCAW